jgi:hypothetical protein
VGDIHHILYLSLSLGTLIGLISTVLQALCVLIDGVLGRVSSLPSPVLCLQPKSKPKTEHTYMSSTPDNSLSAHCSSRYIMVKYSH